MYDGQRCLFSLVLSFQFHLSRIVSLVQFFSFSSVSFILVHFLYFFNFNFFFPISALSPNFSKFKFRCRGYGFQKNRAHDIGHYS